MIGVGCLGAIRCPQRASEIECGSPDKSHQAKSTFKIPQKASIRCFARKFELSLCNNNVTNGIQRNKNSFLRSHRDCFCTKDSVATSNFIISERSLWCPKIWIAIQLQNLDRLFNTICYLYTLLQFQKKKPLSIVVDCSIILIDSHWLMKVEIFTCLFPRYLTAKFTRQYQVATSNSNQRRRSNVFRVTICNIKTRSPMFLATYFQGACMDNSTPFLCHRMWRGKR